jgi:tRNA(fMet)-specific endonuclease VapC
MRYVLDTNILIHAIRKSEIFVQINQKYALFSGDHDLLISAVSIGELESFALQNQWGQKRMNDMTALLTELKPISVSANRSLIRTYAEIDAFSQGKHPTLTLNNSARNMGKNDLWIATTAAIHEAMLLSTDADFTHLDAIFFYFDQIEAN